MAAPTIQRVYPADGDTGIPVGETLKVYFAAGVDLQTIKDSIVLFGGDFDQTSGPDSSLWIDSDTGDNPFFLASPGFKGLVPLKFELAYWDTTDTVTYAEVSSPVTITSEADEGTNNYGHLVKITVDPKYNASLAPDTQFTLYINGDPDSTGTGTSARTVFDLVADGGNTGSGTAYVAGTYSGVSADTFNIEITKAGNIGTAEYKWWWTSAGVGSATLRRMTNRRFRNADQGIQVRFTGSNLAVGDSWAVNVEPIERMATSTSVTFTTNDGSYTAAPSSPSTPATSTPAASVLPSSTEPFAVDFMDPEVASYNVDPDKRVITITFTEDVDASTITDDSIKLFKYPVEGFYQGTFEPIELEKSMTVSGSVVTIRF